MKCSSLLDLRRLSISLVAAFAVAVGGVAMSAPASAHAASGFNSGAHGHDISWPQCGSPFPAIGGNNFGIVGANDGTPFTLNPCFKDEWQWATHGGAAPSVYINLQYGESGQAAGSSSCDPHDIPCRAYAYGWNSAQYAFVTAYANSEGAVGNAQMWFLDVEQMNAWNDNQILNQRIVQGAIDYLQKIQNVQVGIYSTNYQWGQIAGASAPAGIPNWVAGANDGGDNQCGKSLWPGGQVALYQWIEGDFDNNAGC